ncbi:E3 ubiquitin-protein ligase CHIP-like [Planococcus citri]|uniref:E3 ubiquitin-protein ligase CHIP-like n=1 Tax=Planococcus citri TaxID=170843 RepID=UPI0031F93067
MNEYHNSTISSGNELNDRGLQFLNSGKYDEAINYFNKAIVRNPSVPAYFTNRAQCYLKLQRWESACHDCRNAIGLDSNHAEGYHFLGLALLELQRYDEAIKNILRGYFAAMEQNQVSFKNNDTCKQVESAINKRRASQGKKPIVVVGFSTRVSF